MFNAAARLDLSSAQESCCLSRVRARVICQPRAIAGSGATGPAGPPERLPARSALAHRSGAAIAGAGGRGVLVAAGSATQGMTRP